MRALAPLFLALGACASVDSGIPDPTKPATVLFFITTDCPIANSFAPEIKRILSDYSGRAAFAIVYTDPTVSMDAVSRHAADFGYDARIIRDEAHELVKRVGATMTPQAIVLGPDGKRLYRGRIDDRYVSPGKYRIQPTTRELRDALDAVAAGRAVAVAETDVAGCPIVSP